MKRFLIPASLSAVLVATVLITSETPATPAPPARAEIAKVWKEHTAREATRLRSEPRVEILRTAILEHQHQIARRKARAAAREAAATAAAAAAASTPAPASTAPVYTYSGTIPQAQLTSMLLAAGFPESAISTMLYIIDRESGGNPGAINSSSGACGLTQIYPYVAGCLDPMTNLRLAFQKYSASGFSPWSM